MASLERNEITFAIFLAISGFLISWQPTVNWFNSQTPITGLIVKYVFLFCVLGFVLKLFGLRIGKLELDGSLKNILGSIMIIFAFLIVFNFVNSPLAQIYADGGGASGYADNLSHMLLISEDGSFWWLYHNVIGIQGVEMLRFLTYVLTPLLLGLIGGLLVSQRSFKQALGMVV